MRNSRIIRKNQQQATSRLSVIGNIRIGEKRQNSQGKEYPVSLDYFKATGNYASKFTEVYGEKPSTIQVVFISDDNFQSCHEEYDARDKAGRRAGYGDGETTYLWNGKDYEPTTDRKFIDEYTKKNGITWKPRLTLHFIIPAIRGVFGVWKFETSGDKSSMNAIRDVYDEIQATASTVINIPFDLQVKKVSSNKPDTKSVYPVVNLVPNISSENMEQLRGFMEAGMDIKRIGMLTDQKLAALPTAADETKAEPKKQADLTQPVTEAVQVEEADYETCPACKGEDTDIPCAVCGGMGEVPRGYTNG